MSTSAPLDDPALACLFSGHDRVDGLRALHEWAQAMDELVRLGTTQAHEVAHHKWQWWREELDRLAAGSPRHPLTQRLRAAAPEAGLWNWLPERLEGVQFELAGVVPDDSAAAERWDWRREGVVQATALQLLAGSRLAADGPAMAFARTLGRVLGRLAATEAPAFHAAQGRLGLPLDALEAAGLPLEQLPAAFAQEQHSPGLAGVLAAERRIALEEARRVHALWGELPRGPVRAAAIPSMVRLGLAERRLQRLARAAVPLRVPLKPTPWRSLWVAWRAARRSASG